MDSNLASLVGILFKILFGLATLNMIINLFLLHTQRKPLYKLLAWYWPAVLGTFFVQSIFQHEHLPIILGYGASLIPLTIFSIVGFEVTGSKFPLKKYLAFYLCSFPVVILLHYLDYGFTVAAMPLAIATAAPMMHAFYKIHVEKRASSTKLQKLLGGMYVLQSIHCINFALFRVNPENQLWGWIVAYAIYDTLAILLPAIALEQAGRFEQQRLQAVVDEKTAELNLALREKDNLLRILLHDISNPLMVAMYFATKKGDAPLSDAALEKVQRSHEAIQSILHKVKELYAKSPNQSRKANLRPVALEECFDEVSFIFANPLQKKNITLSFENKLSPTTKVLADKATLTHNVLSNLVSNGLKFSQPNSEIIISAKEAEGNVVLEVKDSGPGISAEVLQGLFLDQEASSTMGTLGESGSGFGLSIVKSFVDSYGGKIEIDPKYMVTNPHDHGTSVRITLDRV